jgi:hypothetical protein
MFSRAERRHHVERLKHTRKNYWGYGGRAEYKRVEMGPKQLGRVVQHPQICSCVICGNERRNNGNSKDARTLQERIQLEDLRNYKFEE